MASSVVPWGGTHPIQVRFRPFAPRVYPWNSRRRNPRGKLELRKCYVVRPLAVVKKGNHDEGVRHVEVIGVGSRKDAVLDFCLDSPYKSPALRLWTTMTKESTKLQLQQKLLEKDFIGNIVDPPILTQSSPQAIIIVATAGYGLDQALLIDILRDIQSPWTLIVAIVLKPFCFEGQRRQDEVQFLVENIQEYVDFCIDIDTNLLLRNEMVTLDEALKTANNAVLLAINAVAVLTSSESHRKLFDLMQNKMKEINVPDVIEVLKRYKEGKIGFGAGYNVETSVRQALSECPFLGLDLKDLNGTAVCILTIFSADHINANAFLQAFCKFSGYEREVIVSSFHDPNMEAGLLLTTIISVGFLRENAKEEGILSRVVQSFPFFFNLLEKCHHEMDRMWKESSPLPVGPLETKDLKDSSKAQEFTTMKISEERGGQQSRDLQVYFNAELDRTHFSRSKESALRLSENGEQYGLNVQSVEGNLVFQRERLKSSNFGPVYEEARVREREREYDSSSPTIANLSTFQLPVGVKPSVELKDGPNTTNSRQNGMLENENVVKAEILANVNPSQNSSADVGLGALQNFYNAASTLLEEKSLDVSKKQGNLSVRAASMLDAERNTPRTWNPVIEMEYRGCFYKGRCQGGLPEGKGRLVLGDGSIYDGMWHNGKRSGSGTYYFCNGDVFQGSWRDDFMHGKGWFYFHTGDRWFANFWKGRANGEGRFYAKSGDIFFGCFKDGWRQGHFLCIGVDGQRFVEIWDQGVLLSRQQLTPTLDG